MRVAALYDIHGNLPALEAVIDEVAAEATEAILVGGDLVFGPMPRETLQRLRAVDRPIHFIRGNTDREVVAHAKGGASALPDGLRELMRWVAAQLAPEEIDTLDGWPLTERLTIEGLGDVRFCHATPRVLTPENWT
jgi:predicted phosphodiesterase